MLYAKRVLSIEKYERGNESKNVLCNVENILCFCDYLDIITR